MNRRVVFEVGGGAATPIAAVEQERLEGLHRVREAEQELAEFERRNAERVAQGHHDLSEERLRLSQQLADQNRQLVETDLQRLQVLRDQKKAVEEQIKSQQDAIKSAQDAQKSVHQRFSELNPYQQGELKRITEKTQNGEDLSEREIRFLKRTQGFGSQVVRDYEAKKGIEGKNGEPDETLTLPAELKVKIATPLKNLVGEPARYTHTEELKAKYRTKPAPLPGGLKSNPRKLPGGTDTKVVIKNEIVQAYQAVYETTTNSQGKEVTNLIEVLDNSETEELEKQALAAIDVENLRIKSEDSGSGVYAGLKKIELDGAIQQVAIQRTDSGGMTTIVSRNSEVSVVVPDFDQRQRNIALKDMITKHNDTVNKTEQVNTKGA